MTNASTETKPSQSRKDGGPAFPHDNQELGGAHRIAQPGMSLRDWFAGQALAGEIASYAGSCGDPANYAGDIAARCYKLADAMLAEREKQA